MGFIKNFLTIDAIDHDDARRRKLLNIYMLGIMGIVVVLLLTFTVLYFFGGTNSIIHDMAFYRAIISVCILVFCLAVIYLINRFISGYFASILFIIALTCTLLVSDEPSYLVSGRSQFILILPIILGGILIRPYMSIVLAVLNSLLLFLISRSINMSPNIFSIAFFYLVALVSWIYARNHENTLRNFHKANKRLTQELAERSRMEDALRLSDEKYHSLLNNFQGIIFKGDFDFVPNIFEGEVNQITGYPKDSFLYKRLKWDYIVHPEDHPIFKASLEKLKKGIAGTNEVEYRIVKMDGTIRWVNEFVQNIFDEAGNPVGLQGLIYDITERKTIDLKLEEAQKRLQAIFDYTLNGILLVNDEWEIVDANPAACELSGYSKDELLSIKIFDMILKERDEFIKDFNELTVKGKIFGNYEVKKRDGTEIIISFVAVMDILKGLHLAVFQDITKNKMDEEALRSSQYLLKKVFDSLTDAVFIIDSVSPAIMEANPAAARMFGYTHDEFVENGIKLLNLNEELESDFSASLKDAKQFKKTLKNFEYRMKRKDDTVFPTEQTVVPLEDDKGAQFGWLMIIRNIARRKMLEEQLLQSQKMEALGRLAGGIAHDFNNLLTTILGYCQLSSEGKNTDNTYSESFLEIKNAAERAASLTNQLLSFSRKQMLQLKVVSLNEMFINMKKMLERLIGENITFDVRLEENLWLTRIDPGQIEQVIMNLVVNAKDAISGTGIISVETANSQVGEFQFADLDAGEYVMLKISDDGRGMDKETVHRIFEPFFTTKEQGKGVGLGLSTVFGIIKQSGGHVEVQSKIKKGTTFIIYLPRCGEEQECKETEESQVSNREGSETILFVEDDDSLRKMFYKILIKKGYNVIDAASGPDALHLVKERKDLKPDLLVTDVIMPYMNGNELAANLKNIFPDLKILYISGYTDDTLLDTGSLSDGISFLQKPFPPMDLVDRIRAILD
ncbi:MAG: PAS domain S-box protein [Spirochaetales bacterium]|nr:PAS domain S-box protein [Spirochaetales bacterium]